MARWHVEMYEGEKLAHIEAVKAGEKPAAIIATDQARWQSYAAEAQASAVHVFQHCALDADSPTDDTDIADTAACQAVLDNAARLLARRYQVRRCQSRYCACRFQ